MATGGNNRINFQVGFNVDKAGLNLISQAFLRIQNIKPANFQGTQKELNAIKNEALRVELALNNAFNPKLNSINFNQFKQNLNGLGIDKIYTDFNKLGATGKAAFNTMSTSILTTNTTLRQTSSFVQNIGTTLMNTAKWTVASTAIRAFTSSISQAFTYVKSLDSSLNDIRIVTKDSANLMANFAAQANKAASELGRSTLDYTKAALTFYQQGLDDLAVQARTLAVLKAQNITGAGSLMADYLTAVWNGYKVANEEAETYVDKLAAVADSSASNMSLIAIAMSKVSSAANILGVDVDSLAAQIATIVATTRLAPLSVGNALKTVYARINDISTGADEAEVSLGNYSEAMLKVGVSVLDSNGKLRNTGDVIDEVGEKWSSLSREQQIFLARTMAGQRQYNKLITLFDNWSKYTDLVTVSMLSQGATELKNAIYMESLAAHTERLGAAQLRLKSSMVDSDSYKGMIDVATQGVTLFANFILSIGGGGNALLGFASILTSVFSGVISKEINNVITNMQNVKYNAEIVQNTITTLDSMTKDLSAVGGTTIATERLNQVRLAYTSLTALQQNNYNSLIQNETAQSNLLIILELRKNALLELKTAFGEKWDASSTEEFNLTLHGIENMLENVDGSLDLFRKNVNALKNEARLDSFLEQLKEVYDTTGQSNLKILEIISTLEKAKATGFKDIGTDKLNNIIRLASYLINLYRNLLDNISDEKIYNVTQALEQQRKVAAAAAADTQRAAEAINRGFEIQGIIKGVAGIGQLASGIRSLTNISKIWANDTLSFGEQILQTFTSVGFALPMILTSVNKISQGFSALALKMNGSSILTLKNEIAILENKKLQILEENKKAIAEKNSLLNSQKKLLQEKQNTTLLLKQTNVQTVSNKLAAGMLTFELAEVELNKIQTTQELLQLQNDIKQLLLLISQLTAEGAETKLLEKQLALKKGLLALQQGLSGVMKKLFTGPYSWAAWGAAAMLAITGIILLIRSIPSELDQLKELAKKFSDQAKLAENNFKSISEQINTLTSDMNSLAEATSALHALTEGTEDWKNKLAEVNQQVLNLILKYPLLKNFLTVSLSGLLGIEAEGWSKVQQNLNNRQQLAASQVVISEQRSTQADNKVLVAELANLIGIQIQDLNDILKGYTEKGEDVFKEIPKVTRFGYNNDSEIIEAIQNAKGDIVKLSLAIDTNNQKTLNLTSSIIKSSTDFSKLQGYDTSSNKGAFQDLYANRIANLGRKDLGEEYYTLKAIASGTNDSKDGKISYSTGKVIDFEAVLKKFEEQYDEVIRESDGTYSAKIGDKVLKFTEEGIIAGVARLEADTNQIAAEVAQRIRDIENLGNEKAFALLKSEGDKIDIDRSMLSSSDIDNLLGQVNKLANIFNIDPNKLKEELEKSKAAVEEAFKNYVSTLDPIIQQAFSELGIDSSKYSKEAAIALANMLNSALQSNNFREFEGIKNITSGMSDASIIAFSQLAKTLDYSNLTADQFRLKLREAGISTQTTNTLLEKYINSQKQIAELNGYEQNAQIKEIVSSLKQGETLTKDKYLLLLKLDEGFAEFFAKNIDGEYLLIAKTDEFQKAVNDIKLDNLREQLSTNNYLLSTLLAAKTGQTNTTQQLDIMDLFGGNTVDLRLLLQAAIEKNNEDLYLKVLEKIKNAYQLMGISADEIDSKIKNITADNEAIVVSLEKAEEKLKVLDSDVDKTQWENLTLYLQDYADKLPEVADSVKENKDVAELLAEELLRYDSALESVSKNYLTWEKQLTSGAILDQVKAGNELQNVYSDLLDLPFENLSPDFTQSITNLNDLKAAMLGDLEAYNRLADAARLDIAVNVGFNDENFQNEFNQLYSQLYDTPFEDLEIGASLDDEEFLRALSEMITAAGMTAELAQDYLASMGIDAEVHTSKAPMKSYELVVADGGYWKDEESTTTVVPADGLQEPYPVTIHRAVWVPVQEVNRQLYEAEFQAASLLVKSAHKKSGGGFKYSNSTHGGGSGKSGGGKKGGSKKSPKKSSKKKGSKKKPKQEKTVDQDLGIENKLLTYDPYEQVTKLLERQSDYLDKLQNQEDKLTGKDRLLNLKKQNEVLQEQNKKLRERQKISDDASKKNTTAWFKNQLETTTSFKDIIGFDSDGQISDIAALLRNAELTYNQTVQNAEQDYKAVEKKYNAYIKKYNKMSAKKQESSKVQKELLKWKLTLKEAEETAKNAEKSAEEKYKLDVELIKSYTDALLKDNEARQNWLDNLNKITEIKFAKAKIRVDLSLDMGQLERDWIDFEDKFIKPLEKDNFLGQAKSASRNLFSFLDTNELEDQLKTVRNLRLDLITLSRLLDGGLNSKKIRHLLGISVDDWKKMTADLQLAARQAALAMKKEDLEKYLKTLQDSLVSMQLQTDKIRDTFLSALDQVKSDMDDQIKQFDRINSLIEHGAKLSEMLFGEKAYDNAIRFYDMQKKNNIAEMKRIAEDRSYWESIYQQEVKKDAKDQDKLVMQRALDNLQSFDDQLRNTLETTIEILHSEWEAKMQKTIKEMNDTLTNGKGLDFANEEWDYANKYDDYFLDPVESKMGMEEVLRLYEKAIKSANGDAKAQERIRNLLKLQMEVLLNKDQLTQYDIDRAKKSLEIEQARYDLENARNQKTQLRLRRDSQGNYTYQYVADEEQVEDLEDKLANLEYNLYEDDKNQYKKNLKLMMSAHEEYTSKIVLLEWALRQAKEKNDEAEIERISNRINLLNEYLEAYQKALNENQGFIKNDYWTQSTAMSLGVSNDNPAEMLLYLLKNLPIVGVAYEDFSRNITAAGGYLLALAPYQEQLSTISLEYAASVKEAMEAAQTSTLTMTADVEKAVAQTGEIVTGYEKIISATQTEVELVDKLLDKATAFMNTIRESTEMIKNMYQAYYKLQDLNLLDEDDNKNGTNLISRLQLDTLTLNEKMQALMTEWDIFYKSLFDTTQMASGGYTGAWGQDGKIAVLHEKELVLSADDTSNILSVVQTVRDITSSMSIDSGLQSLANSQSALLGNLLSNTQLDQNVHIDANFPNVTNHVEIEKAFNNLVNMASMYASRKVL